MMKKACLFDTFYGPTDGANVAVGRTPQIGPETHIFFMYFAFGLDYTREIERETTKKRWGAGPSIDRGPLS